MPGLGKPTSRWRIFSRPGIRFLGYLRWCHGFAIDEIRRTQVREGLAVWFIYNMGYGVQDAARPSDRSRRAGRGAGWRRDLDFLLNTHEHGDHVH
jgi:glyoxylase-like metal-dependent hydrolase (beta-lactamase superfamily II)